jgi:glucosamine-phosphate N-acetyltransferase
MEKANYQVRELEKKDLDSNFGYLETLKNLTEVKDLPVKKLEEIFDKVKSQGTYIFVAVKDDGQIIGAVSLLIEQKFTHGGVLAGHIEEVATRKEFEGMGVASTLIKKAIEIVKENNCYKLILDCKDSLVPFYERFGFESKGNYMRIDFNG